MACEIFVSYAHEDESFREEFSKSLSQLQRENLIGEWNDRRLTSGSEWAGQIDEHLNSAQIVVLLVSPDFLSSPYCNDMEMTRALERRDKGETRVVPVILRPCDWETSRLGKLTALPRDGKPIIDWPTHDHGFLDVAKGIRRMLAELAREPAVGKKTGVTAGRRRPLLRWALALVAAILLAWFWWSHQNTAIAKGNGLLDIGRYRQARESYAMALQWNPFSGSASLGLAISKLDETRADAVTFESELSRLAKQAPANPYLKVMQGDYLLGRGKQTDALKEYEAAAKLRPELAEAWFGMGAIYDLERRPGPALEAYRKAAQLSPSSPHYVDNLADQYFKHGQYDDAIREYQTLDRFPLARLEMARMFRLMGELDQAVESEKVAAGWLENDSLLATVPENQDPWLLDSISVQNPKQKICYARYSLSATLFLSGDQTGAKENADRAGRACEGQELDVKRIIHVELDRLKSERADLAKRAEIYAQTYLE